ncbi:hypothetical protein ACX0MU_27540 [Rhizorhabdus wittichii]
MTLSMASAAMVNAAEAGLFDLLASSLPSILTRLQARRSDMDRYQYLMERVGRCDVRTDAHFQRTFNGLYMVRRGAPWRKAFYDLFETQKTAGEQSFQHVLTVLHDLTGRVEASFASKLLATIDPAMPVYDPGSGSTWRSRPAQVQLYRGYRPCAKTMLALPAPTPG